MDVFYLESFYDAVTLGALLVCLHMAPRIWSFRVPASRFSTDCNTCLCSRSLTGSQSGSAQADSRAAGGRRPAAGRPSASLPPLCSRLCYSERTPQIQRGSTKKCKRPRICCAPQSRQKKLTDKKLRFSSPNVLAKGRDPR